MTKTFSLSTGLLLASALAACSSSSNEPADAALPPSGADAARDAKVTDAKTDRTKTDTAKTDARGAETGSDASDGGGAPPPPPGLTKQIVSGRVSLVGSGANSCTNQAGATGDRWCGFAIPSGTSGQYELWVFDATRAAGGADVLCDGTDASCLRLTTNAYFDRLEGPGNDGFVGDTLIYQADADPSSPQSFVGPISAWRPGWTAGRVLTSGAGVVCSAHETQPVALCLQDQSTNADGDVSYTLVAGALPAPGGPPLATLESVLTAAGTDPAAGDDQFEVGLSPDGTYVAWSARPTATGKETLKVQKIDDTTTRQTVATDVSNWEISKDGTSWLWLSAFNQDDLEPSGTLELATFPAGTNVSTLAAGVADYEGVGDKGVLYRAGVINALGDLRLMPDRDAPATTTLLDQTVAAVVATSDDARTVIYTKTITGVGNDLFAWSASLATPCAVWTTPSATRTVTLMSNDHVLVWAQGNILTQAVSAAATSLDACTTTTFGADLLRFLPAGDDRLLFVDGAPDGSYTGMLRATAVDEHGVGDVRTPLSALVDPVYAPLAPTLPAVLYTGGAGGLYIYVGPLLGSPTQPDAGSDAESDASIDAADAADAE